MSRLTYLLFSKPNL